MNNSATPNDQSFMSLRAGQQGPIKKKRPKASSAPTIQDYVSGILKQDRSMLARAVTLIESNAPMHQQKSKHVLKEILPYSGQALRIGITGYPGAGKSTLIESLGLFLVQQGYKVAVLAIDPSSSLTRGSILGDKTRMERLATHPSAFIRPSPSSGTLGGVTRKSRETILLCEAAGYDVILVETVGVGQNEISVRQMVDFYLLVMIAGAGDDLQGIKKGVIEMADAILINKADGHNLQRTQQTKHEFEMTLKYLSSYTQDWNPPALTASALEHRGISELWACISSFKKFTQKNGTFEQHRSAQNTVWLQNLLEEAVFNQFMQQESIASLYQDLRQQVAEGSLWAPEALETLIQKGFSKPNESPGS